MWIDKLKGYAHSILLTACLVFVMQEASAAVIFRQEFPDFDLGTWGGMGDRFQSQEACIVSYTGSFFNPQPQPYSLTASGPFTLSDGVGNQLPFSLEVTDLNTNGTQSLEPGIPSGDLTWEGDCSLFGGPPETRLRFTVSQSDLFSVPEGDYTVTRNLTASGVGDSDNQSYSASVSIDPLIQITHIDDISFGVYDGVSPVITQNESFCVYTNSVSAEYSITASSTPGATPADYRISSGADYLDYRLRFSNTLDASGGIELDNGSTLPNVDANQASPLSQNCNGGDNAAVFVTIDGTDLQAAPPGSYSGTLTLMVSPI